MWGYFLHDTMLEDDSYRTGTSTSSACECRSDRETAEHFLLHCTIYQHIRKDTTDLALDILNVVPNVRILKFCYSLHLLMVSPWLRTLLLKTYCLSFSPAPNVYWNTVPSSLAFTYTSPASTYTVIYLFIYLFVIRQQIIQ